MGKIEKEQEEAQEAMSAGALFDDDDEGGGVGDSSAFDDGAAPGMGGDMDNEDGREGLDMEDEDLFDDDENDAFEDDDEQAVHERQEAQRGDGTLGDTGEIDDPVEATGARSDWGKSVREARKGVSKYEKEAAGVDDDDDDDDDDDEGTDLLRSILSSSEPEPTTPVDAKGRAVKSEEASEGAASAGGAGGKRKAVAGGAADDAKRVKTEAAPVPAALPPVKRAMVSQKEVVEVIHRSPRMTIKQLIDKFKEFLKDKDAKAKFMAIIKEVAKLVNEGDEKVVVLRATTLDEYGLNK